MVKNNFKQIPSIQILGSRVHMVQIPEVVELIAHWIEKESQKYHWIVVTGMHGVMEAYRDVKFKAILNSADLFVPDGISLIWIARYRGFPLKKRVSGADLMWEYFKLANKKGYRNFFYGDTKETLQELAKKLLIDFPELKIVGLYSPPFRALTPEEDAEIVRKINEKKPDILWVALGLPEQERWIFEHRDKLEIPVVIGVGAAFKFLSGKVKRAPAWLGDLGLEWLWRFFHEPRKLWRRVFLDIPAFIFLVLLELIGFKTKK
ncbi:MAG: WecB/TagA/CpsF family glycosyltransferase [Candidatus Nealsonbacteria bacterium]